MADIHGGLDPELSPQAFTFPHWSQVTPYTSTYVLAESCVFAKQSVGLLHCGLARSQAPLLPKLRGNFAEFLKEVSLTRLRILISDTCVGLRYGCPSPVRAFLGTCFSYTFAAVALISSIFSALVGSTNSSLLTVNDTGSAGILTCCASITPLGLTLAPD